MSLDTTCLSCSKSDLFINKFDSCIQKRIKAPKNASGGHESIGCVITDSKCLMFYSTGINQYKVSKRLNKDNYYDNPMLKWAAINKLPINRKIK